MTRGYIAWNNFRRPDPGADMLIVIMPSGTLWPAHERAGQLINDAPGHEGQVLAGREKFFQSISGWKRDPHLWGLLVNTYKEHLAAQEGGQP